MENIDPLKIFSREDDYDHQEATTIRLETIELLLKYNDLLSIENRCGAVIEAASAILLTHCGQESYQIIIEAAKNGLRLSKKILEKDEE